LIAIHKGTGRSKEFWITCAGQQYHTNLPWKHTFNIFYTHEDGVQFTAILRQGNDGIHVCFKPSKNPRGPGAETK
jgi:hypothetical protein